MTRLLSGLMLVVAFTGAIIVYHEQLTGIVKGCGDIIANLGTGRSTTVPKIEFKTPAQAIEQGKGRGLAHVKSVLNGTVEAAVNNQDVSSIMDIASALAGEDTSPSAGGAPASGSGPKSLQPNGTRDSKDDQDREESLPSAPDLDDEKAVVPADELAARPVAPGASQLEHLQ